MGVLIKKKKCAADVVNSALLFTPQLVDYEPMCGHCPTLTVTDLLFDHQDQK